MVSRETGPPLDSSLLPIYQEYQSWAGEIGLWTYISMRADFDLAAAFSKLFWPDFVEVEGCVLLAEHYSAASYEHWKERLDGNRVQIEAQINLTPVWDLFLNSAAVLDRTSEEVQTLYKPELFEYLGKILSVCWRCSLQEAFPEKKFKVTYAHGPGDYGPIVTFHQLA